MKMTKSAIVLVIGFFLATLDDIDNIFRYVHSADYYLFSKNGLVLFYFTSGALLFILNAASVYFLLMPKIHGYYIAFSALLLGMAVNMTKFLLASGDLEGYRAAYILGRELRGLPVREKTLDLILSPEVITMIMAVTLALYLIMLFLLYRSRHYFRFSKVAT